jgi:myo-inositol-1(or 4)-monophosphatase
MLSSQEIGLRLSVASALAHEAGQLALRRFRDRGFKIGFKGPQDFLTEVDQEVERLIAARLHALFPDDGFIGEEGGGRVAKGEAPIWVVDPIDGTANFARGTPHFCVSIALTDGRKALAGAIYDPAVDELFTAQTGGGAFLNGAPMRVTETTALRTAAVEVGWNLRSGPEIFLSIMRQIAESGAAPMRCGSGALALAYVAAGRTDAFLEPVINAWDCLAGNVLVEEAGGYVSDFLARDGLSKGNALLACTPGLRAALSEIAAKGGIVL